MTLFGDLDVSTLREPPPGRQKVHTYLGQRRPADAVVGLLPQEARRRAAGLRHRAARRGSRSGRGGQRAADVRSRSAAANWRTFALGLLHGRMTPAEKDAAMEAFRSGRTQVLVATSVVEVGVDVPNATLMTIEGGERFGLAQLHQLRGRISRGSHPGYLLRLRQRRRPTRREQRLDAFTKTTDGFELAEIDFQLRGPGDLFGTKQHGLPPLRIADLARRSDRRRSPPRCAGPDRIRPRTRQSRLRPPPPHGLPPLRRSPRPGRRRLTPAATPATSRSQAPAGQRTSPRLLPRAALKRIGASRL